MVHSLRLLHRNIDDGKNEKPKKTKWIPKHKLFHSTLKGATGQSKFINEIQMRQFRKFASLVSCLKALLLLQQACMCACWLTAVSNRVRINNYHTAKVYNCHWTTHRSCHRLQASSEGEGDTGSDLSNSVRFLGRGENAIVRPGVVLLAPREEFHHFLREAAVFIYGMGYDDYDVYVIRGAIIDHPTPFTLEEMRDQGNAGNDGQPCQLFQNMIFRGGDVGGESAFLLHSDDRLAQRAGNEMIGTSGIYQGGFETALSDDQENIYPEKFKFFFNYMEFTEQELENMLGDPQEDGDAWTSIECPPDIVLSSDWSRGDAWRNLRNAIRMKS